MRQRRPIFALLVLLAAPAGAGCQSVPAEAEQCLGGQLDAPIRIDIFSDFQCPSCRNLYLETIRPILKDYCALNKVCVVYHEFPLPMHAYARDAARFSVAAQRVGRRQWQRVVDALYDKQPQWSADGKVGAIVAAALEPGDFEKVRKLREDPSIDKTVERELALGRSREVQSTPTFFVYAIGREQKVVGMMAYPILKQYFDRIVK